MNHISQAVSKQDIRRGPIDTAIFRKGEEAGLFDAAVMGADTLLGRMGKADEVAKVLCFLLSDDASYVTGGMWRLFNR
jgi:NAD(P)-dependent dehydrogenase (short-subunit alcohol dehydrogenase family)